MNKTVLPLSIPPRLYRRSGGQRSTGGPETVTTTPQPIYTEDGIPRYKLQDSKAVERTEEEIQADREAMPKPEPAPTVEELQAKITALTTSNQMLEDCLVEMAGVIYA